MGIFMKDSSRSSSPAEIARYNTPRAFVASARPMSLTDEKEGKAVTSRRRNAKWQDDAWDFYDSVGELWSAANFVANIISRIRIYPAYIQSHDSAPKRIQDEDSLPPEVAQIAEDAMSSLESGTGGIPALLRDFALNMFIAGECYLVRSPEKPYSGEPESWAIYSVSELVEHHSRDSQWGLRLSRDAKNEDIVPLSQSYYLARMWRQHPRYSNEADSSLRPILDKADEVLLYDRASRTAARSRLNAGLLYIPDSIAASMGTDGDLPTTDDMAPLNDDEADTFEDDLINALIDPIEDEASASSVAPIMLRGPENASQHIKHISFERSLDNLFSARADRALERMIAGLDLPKEVVSGFADLKYSNAIQVEDTLYKANIEPLMLAICDSLTAVFLKPILAHNGYNPNDIRNVAMWFDSSAITAKPDMASAATEGYNLQIISAKTWRRVHDFSESDAPSPEETIQRLALSRGIISEPVNDMALRSIAPEMVEDMQKRLQNNDAIIDEEPPEDLIEP